MNCSQWDQELVLNKVKLRNYTWPVLISLLLYNNYHKLLICDVPLVFLCILIFSLPISFTVNLKRGNDIAFHLNPRFNEDRRQVIVRNSMIGNQWGKEEREIPSFPFVPGKPFEVSMAPNNFVSFSSQWFYLD